MKYMKKNTSILRNHILHGNSKEFTSFLALMELRKTSQTDDAFEISTEDGIRKRRQFDGLSVGGRLSYYFLLCHIFGDNHTKQREFEANLVALTAHAFTSL